MYPAILHNYAGYLRDGFKYGRGILIKGEPSNKFYVIGYFDHFHEHEKVVDDTFTLAKNMSDSSIELLRRQYLEQHFETY